MIHLDIKTLGRVGRPGHRVTGNRRDRVVGIGWEHLHVAIDDCSRLAYTEVLPDLGREDATGFDAYKLSRPHSAFSGISPFQKLNNLLGNDRCRRAPV